MKNGDNDTFFRENDACWKLFDITSGEGDMVYKLYIFGKLKHRATN